MRSILSKLFYLFGSRSKLVISVLLVMILVGTVLEMFGIGAILPLVTLFSSPNPLEANLFLKKVHDWLKPSSDKEFAIFILAGVLFVFLVKNVYLLLLTYFQTRFTQRKHYQLACRLFKGYLHGVYSFHLKNNSSELIRNIKIVSNVINFVLIPLIMCFSEAMIAVAILSLLVWVDYISAILVTGILGAFLGLYFLLVKKKMSILGEDNKHHEGKIYQQMYESFSSIKEIKISGQENFFKKNFSTHMWGVTDTYRFSSMITQSGRYIVEALTVTLVMGIIIYLLYLDKEPSTVLITFSLFAVAFVRLMPTINRLNWAFTQIKYGIPSLDEIFDQVNACEKFFNDTLEKKQKIPLLFQSQIEFRDVTFRYENAEKNSLESISFVIPKKSSVGIVGSSGSGKSTVIDLLTGLLQPLSGNIMVDDRDISRSPFSWQQQIGYIPQSIFLLDDTIRNNIAFGVQKELIDDGRVWEVLNSAQLSSFVKKLPDGLDTLVGENGARMSGGERQRIGIARALYREPQVLIMDEATASLDSETERSFIDSVENLSKEKTIIMVSHKVTSIKNCDRILFFSEGRLIDSGHYDFLLSTNKEFKNMAQL